MKITLKSNLPQSKSFHPHFEAALGDMLDAGGKRFRPMLLLSVVGSIKTHSLIDSALPVALGVRNASYVFTWYTMIYLRWMMQI